MLQKTFLEEERILHLEYGSQYIVWETSLWGLNPSSLKCEVLIVLLFIMYLLHKYYSIPANLY